ncbi:helix-turn-helix domain-containing protein [Candidatus Uhrbacteria bacterium]|nr:helix-turn-helix domain-containing protein [Candidatus Uhrbacteria bacterium]
MQSHFVIDPSVKDQFVELRAQGMSFASISSRLNVSKGTLVAWSKELKDELGNMRQIQLEAIREKFRMGSQRRMELFVKQLDAVEGELATRTLDIVSTEKLFDMLVKLGHELNATDAPLTFKEQSKEFVLDDIACMSVWEA